MTMEATFSVLCVSLILINVSVCIVSVLILDVKNGNVTNLDFLYVHTAWHRRRLLHVRIRRCIRYSGMSFHATMGLLGSSCQLCTVEIFGTSVFFELSVVRII